MSDRGTDTCSSGEGTYDFGYILLVFNGIQKFSVRASKLIEEAEEN
jgi:hypothetical protein